MSQSNSCERFQPLIERMLADEISADAMGRLLEHAESCAACQPFVDLHAQLSESTLHDDMPSDAEFDGLRHSVLTRIRADQSQRPADSVGWMERIRVFFAQPAYAAGLASVLVVALASGYFAGRSSVTDPVRLSVADMSDDALVRAMIGEASGHRKLTDVENSPFVISNVKLQPSGDEVEMSFDVTRHVEFSGAHDAPMVREVLAQSLVNPSNVGTRLAAIRQAGRAMDPTIQEALIFSMLNDDNLAVRMNAARLLAVQPPNEDLQAAFLMVLSGEESVQLRLQAMDFLAKSDGGLERMDSVLDTLQVDLAPALQVRASRYQRAPASPQ